MGPAQFATQCVANLRIRVGEVELAEVAEVGMGETFGLQSFLTMIIPRGE